MLQVRIVKEDGAVGLFRGAGPTVVRAMALNMGMLASNDEVRLLNSVILRQIQESCILTSMGALRACDAQCAASATT